MKTRWITVPLALALGLSTAACSNDSADPAPSPTPTVTAASSAGRPTTPDGPVTPWQGHCTATTSIDLTPLDAAPQTRWQTWGKTTVPITEAGPYVVDGYKQKCFAPSLAGAVAAAANITSRQGISSAAMAWEYKNNAQPAGDDAYIAQQNRLEWVKVVSYRIGSVSNDGKHVTVMLGFVAPYEGRVLRGGGIPMPVVWDGSDWKLDRIKDDQNSSSEQQDARYKPWK